MTGKTDGPGPRGGDLSTRNTVYLGIAGRCSERAPCGAGSPACTSEVAAAGRECAWTSPWSPHATAAGFGNALLLTGDRKYIDAWRNMLAHIRSQAVEVDGTLLYPSNFGASLSRTAARGTSLCVSAGAAG